MLKATAVHDDGTWSLIIGLVSHHLDALENSRQLVAVIKRRDGGVIAPVAFIFMTSEEYAARWPEIIGGVQSSYPDEDTFIPVVLSQSAITRLRQSEVIDYDLDIFGDQVPAGWKNMVRLQLRYAPSEDELVAGLRATAREDAIRDMREEEPG